MHLRRGEEKCQSTFRSKIEDTREPVVTRPPHPLILSHFGSLSCFPLFYPSLFLPLFSSHSPQSFSVFPSFSNFLSHSSCFHFSTLFLLLPPPNTQSFALSGFRSTRDCVGVALWDFFSGSYSP